MMKKPNCPVIAIEEHYWDPELAKHFTGPEAGRGNETDERLYDLGSLRLKEMDEAGIDIQVLSHGAPSSQKLPIEIAATLTAQVNDRLAKVCAANPKRFAAFAALPLPHIDESLRELDRARNQLHMAGVANTTAILGRSVADAAFHPIYDELNRRKSVLFLHPAGNNANSSFIADAHLTWFVGAPVEDLIAVAQLINAGIPKRFPDMKIINSHLGGAVPTMLARWDSVSTWEEPAIPEKPSIAARRMWYDTVDYGDAPALRAAVDTLGATQLVLGSDFPYESGKAYELCANYIRDSGLPAADVMRILRSNAAGLLRL